MLQAMHASNARKQCRYETNVTNGLRRGLSTREILTFRNARAHMPTFSPADFRANPRRDPEPSDLSATRARIDREVTT